MSKWIRIQSRSRIQIQGSDDQKFIYFRNVVKEQADRVEAALDRHGVKLDESGADLRRANIAMAAALDRQAARMDIIEDTLNHAQCHRIPN